jgi:hypothetical protein
MYKNNQIYGNAKVLNQFAGRSLYTPIWGEVQHSLDFKIEVLKTLRTPRVIKSFFTWRSGDSSIGNSYFGRKWRFVPIGDPFLYQFLLEQPRLDLRDKTKVLIVPKYDRGQSQKNRLERHFEIARQFGPQRSSEIEVSLHPGEINDTNTRQIYENLGIVLRTPRSFFDQDFLAEEIKYLSRVSEVYTNYLGPTLLRSVYLGAKGTFLKGFIDISGVLKNRNVFGKHSSQITELELANELLGRSNIMSSEELLIALSGNVNELLAARLQQIKFLCEKNFTSVLTSKKLIGIKVLCTNCIQLSAAKFKKGRIICASCGYTLRADEDFYCEKCHLTRKRPDLENHLNFDSNHIVIL